MIILSALIFFAGAISTQAAVLVDAESFDELGGWKIDQQFVDQMGSPILIAHGMGIPVEDAQTTIEVPADGEYTVWVRTRDWVAPWGMPGTPGKFELSIDGKKLDTLFGTEGAKWHWQSGGTVSLKAGKCVLALHDLTGFDGRCDAIYLSTDDAKPGDSLEAMEALRQKLLGVTVTPKETETYDLVVVGGGISGTCAAISAARLGLKTALIHNRPVLGGNNSSEVRVHLGGKIHLPPYPALGGVVREIDPLHHGNAQPADYYDDAKKLRVARAEENLTLYLSTHATGVDMKDGKISAVKAINIRTGQRLQIPGTLFCDSTGDGSIGFWAGADYRYGRESKEETGEALAPEEGDRQTMGTSIMWYSQDTGEPSTFPECPWAVQFNEKTCQRTNAGNWNWENGFYRDQVDEAEYVRDYGMRVVYGNWAFQKNGTVEKAKYANRALSWVAYIGGKRESRRLLGDVILKQEDVTGQVDFPDKSVTTTWTIDLHYPINQAGFTEEPFRSVAKHVRISPYPIPYRCFYSRNIDNLFMAGRNISVTHVALGTIRVMRTCGMMGEVVGMAASICKEQDTTPRGVYKDHLETLKELMTEGVGLEPIPAQSSNSHLPAARAVPPTWLKKAGKNLALTAKASASSEYTKASYPVTNVNDGRVSYSDNTLRFVSGSDLPGWVQLDWNEEVTLGAVRVVSGQNTAKTPNANFVIQQLIGDKWVDIEGTKTERNTDVDWGAQFKPIDTKSIRLYVDGAHDNLIRCWEFEAYGPVEK